MGGFRFRYLRPVVLLTLFLVALCAVTAVSLLHQQAAVAGALRENETSRRAAADLRSTLNTLVALETHHVESVADLHVRAQAQLDDIRRLADQHAERELSARLDAGFAEYLRRWHALPPAADPRHESGVADATRYLDEHVLYPCREIEASNDRRITDTIDQHERVLRQLAWGMAGVAGLGGVAGVVLGYGVARGLSRSIRRLQVQVRTAAGKLDPNRPEIILTGEGDFHGLHAQVDELTRRIEAAVQTLHQRDQEVLRAEQLAAVGQLAAGVGHEVRNPLTSIKMLVQAGLEDGGALTPEDLRVIEGEVRRTERSLQAFLDFARPPTPARRPVDLAVLIREVVGLVQGRAGKQRVEARADVPAEPLTVTGDREQLRQVLVNLCLNALDAMPAGGTLTVAGRPRPEDRVEIEVTDTGAGIAPAVLPRLFHPFFSTKDTGVGLGLVISKRITEDHGGTLEAANRTGGGASFCVSLPRGNDDAGAAGR